MTVRFRWEQVFAYLGYRNIIASALMTRLFARAFADLSPDRPADREGIQVLTAFPGDGILEAVELVTRLPTRHPDRFVVDAHAGPADAPEAIGGRFYFEVQVGTDRRGYWPSARIFDAGFREQVIRYQDGVGSPEELSRFRTFKRRTTQAILRAPEDALFSSIVVTPR